MAGNKTSAKRARRVTREQWLQQGLQMLAEGSVGSVRIDILARRPGVAKTSFYWHFRDRRALLDSILEYWEREFTQVISGNVEFMAMPPGERLLRLSEAVEKFNLAQYDLPISAWARHDEVAADVLRRVYRRRFDYVGTAFRELGFRGEDLKMRTRLFLANTSNEKHFLELAPAQAVR